VRRTSKNPIVCSPISAFVDPSGGLSQVAEHSIKNYPAARDGFCVPAIGRVTLAWRIGHFPMQPVRRDSPLIVGITPTVTGVLKNSPPMPPNCRRNLFVCAREERFACVRRALLASPALRRQVYGKSRPAVDRVAPHCFVNINT
jgi:hypothetical protein